jgi:MFS family permease
LIGPPRELRGFFLAVATDSFVWALGSALLFGMLSREFGFSTAQLGVLFGLSSFVWAASQRLFGQWVDRYGCKWFLVLSDVLGLLVVAGWLFSRSYAAFAVTYACHGLVSATWTPAYMSFVAHSLSEEQRGEVMGRLAALRGLVRFPAPYLGGQLYDHLGFRAPLLANWIGLLVALAVLVFLVKEPRHHEEAP